MVRTFQLELQGSTGRQEGAGEPEAFLSQREDLTKDTTAGASDRTHLGSLTPPG